MNSRLFGPYQCRQIGFLLAAIAQLQGHKTLTEADVKALYKANFLAKDKDFEDEEYIAAKAALSAIFEEEDGVYTLILPEFASGEVYLPMTEIERDYLRFLLTRPEAGLFLKPETIAALLNYTAGAPAYTEHIHHVVPPTPDPGISSADFQTLLDAIRRLRPIRYEFCTRDNSTYRESTAIPWKLEYDSYNHSWALILYTLQEKRMIRARLDHLRNIRMPADNYPTPKQVFATVSEAMEKLRCSEPIRLRIKNDRNGLERTFCAFETAEILESKMCDGVTYLTFNWYRFNEDEIIRHLLFLGTDVTLLGPKSLQEKLLAAIEQGIANQTEAGAEQNISE